ncbi:MAG: AmmeMemoRadiSam system protein B [Patescibacteria group bacterium]
MKIRTRLYATCAMIVFLFFGAIIGAFVARSLRNNSSHSSAFLSQKAFYDTAFNSIEKDKIPSLSGVKGAVVNHHLLSPQFIARALTAASYGSKNPETVVLISPNHFGRGHNNIILSASNWETPYGTIFANKSLAKKLRGENVAAIDESPFEYEHGISNITAFIKNTFPDSTILPVIIKDSVSALQEAAFAEELLKNAPENSLFVFSADFSHYTSDAGADFHDEKSLIILNNLEYANAHFLDIDSQAGLRIFLKIMESLGAKRWTMLDHSNSAKITDSDGQEGVTSHITGIFSRSEDINYKKSATILALGDLMLDRGVAETIEEKGEDFVFEKISRFLGGSDLVVANLEGPFTEKMPLREGKEKINFSFNEGLTEVLAKLGVTHLNLANNHTLDSGLPGLQDTRNILTKNNIRYFGDPLNKDEISDVVEIHGLEIAFVGFHQFSQSGFDDVINEIKKLSASADYVMVYAHWGAEMSKYPSRSQIDFARGFIDAGADIVIGTHPHVVQPMDKGHPIFYSLGNFLFDQNFSKEVMQNIGIGIAITPEYTDVFVFPMVIRAGQPHLAEYLGRSILLKNMAIPERIRLSNTK